MKILYISTISTTIETFLTPHIKLLIEQGFEVEIACNIQDGFRNKIDELGLKVHQIDFNRNPLCSDTFRAFRQLKRLIETENYHLIHTHTPVASAIARIITRSKKDIKVVYTAHGFHFFSGAPLLNWLIFYPVEKLLAKHTDAVLTINSEDYLRSLRMGFGNVYQIPGVGIDLKNVYNNKHQSFRSQLGLKDSECILISVGELNQNKNHLLVIDALAKIDNKDITYLICGEGDNRSTLERKIAEYNLTEKVHLLGYREDVREILNSADVFVFPSYREGLAVSIMEAMAAGLPVLASNIRGNSDLIDSDKGGFLFNPNDSAELSSFISELKNNKGKRISFSKYNKEKVKKYELDNVLKILKQVYYNVLSIK